MKFEMGGKKNGNSDLFNEEAPIEIKTRYEDFISKIGGKSSIHDTIRSDVIDNGHDVTGSSSLVDSGIDNDLDSRKIKTFTDISNSDGSYNPSMTSHIDSIDEQDSGYSGRDKQDKPVTESQKDAEPQYLRPSSRRRLSDLDVHLRMMNAKESPLFDIGEYHCWWTSKSPRAHIAKFSTVDFG